MVHAKGIGVNDKRPAHLVKLGALLLPRLGGPATRALLDELSELLSLIEHLHSRVEHLEEWQREHADAKGGAAI